MKIATHNSATGETPKNLISYLVLPFSRTQSKTIREQYIAGCRMFDIRVRYYDGILYCAHGLFLTKRTACSILNEINNFGEQCYVCITYEGRLDKETLPLFTKQIGIWKKLINNVKWGEVCVKYTDNDIKVDWERIVPAEHWHPAVQGFVPLDGRTWQTYIPIPWLWKKIYYNKPEFNDEVFTFVDFL